MNELIFLLSCLYISTITLLCLRIGAEALISLLTLLTFLANLFVAKQILLCSMHTTASDIYTVGAGLTLAILQEFYGRKVAKKAIWISFFLIVCATVLGFVHISYTPSFCDTSNVHYIALLGPLPRIIIASLLAFLSAEYCNYSIFNYLSIHQPKLHFTLRSALSVSASQIVDTILFSFLGLYGMVSGLAQIIIVSLIIKFITIVITSPFLGFATKIHRHILPITNKEHELKITKSNNKDIL